MTAPEAQQIAQLKAAQLRARLALLFVLVGVLTATVGAGLAWGLGPAMVVMGGSLLVLGLFIAAVG